MTAAENVCYTLINVPSDSEPPSEISLKTDLEKGEIKAKTEALKKVIIMILNGEKLPGLLMTIIRFVLPLQDHTIKKLLLVFWEIVPKTTPDGKLLQEMILVCDAYRKDLQHPNEFIRGSTLRFLCKLKEPELLEPLMPAIRACLEHRHSYVRRNAVLAIYTIYRIYRGALWILGEYCSTKQDIQSVMTEIRRSVGEIPIVENEIKKELGEVKPEEEMTTAPAQKLVTEMGTYVTQSALSSSRPSKKAEDRPPLRGFLMDGDFYVGASLATTLTKLALRYVAIVQDKKKQNSFVAEAMLIMATVLHLGKSTLPKKPITDDDVDRISLCLKVLSECPPLMNNIFNKECRESLSRMLAVKLEEEKLSQKKESEKRSVTVQADDPISFMQLTAKSEMTSKEDQFQLSLLAAMGNTQRKEAADPLASKLNKVTQLTGFSDPVYAEAYVHVNQYDIVLDVLVVNQTSDTLQNCTLELATLGDLKLVEKPSPLTLAPHDFANIKANVKVASTENGIIFGNIVYDVSGAASDRNCVVLSDIHIDIMDYIQPATCTDAEFRQMWAEFEWENKVTVNTNIADLNEYLQHILRSTNMKCLTPEKALSGFCGFMAANLYARSIFGEDALANVSIEKPLHLGPEAPVNGHIRIRAKSQGMALSLGDKINLSQKKSNS
ncbi:coatomer subunit beta [Arapaima gigas]